MSLLGSRTPQKSLDFFKDSPILQIPEEGTGIQGILLNYLSPKIKNSQSHLIPQKEILSENQGALTPLTRYMTYTT